MLLPFVAPLVVIVLALNNVRHLPWFGLAAAAVTSVFGIIDLAYVRRLGLVELLIAAAGAAVAGAGFGGTYIRAASDVAGRRRRRCRTPTDGEPIAGSPG